MKMRVIPNDLPKEREDNRGVVRVSKRRTWILLINDDPHGEYRTKREAQKSGARLLEKEFRKLTQ